MRVLRGVLGALLWIVAALVGLIGALLCVTVVLLPVGVPLLMLAGKLFARSMKLLMPSKMTHPVRELGKASRKKGSAMTDSVSELSGDLAKKVKRSRKRHGHRLKLT